MTDVMQDETKFSLDAQDYLKDSINLAVNLLKFQEFVGREEPDVKT
jgi:phosphoglucomutase